MFIFYFNFYWKQSFNFAFNSCENIKINDYFYFNFYCNVWVSCSLPSSIFFSLPMWIKLSAYFLAPLTLLLPLHFFHLTRQKTDYLFISSSCIFIEITLSTTSRHESFTFFYHFFPTIIKLDIYNRIKFLLKYIYIMSH